MKVVNLTPHDCHVGSQTFPASGEVLRMREEIPWTIPGPHGIRVDMIVHTVDEIPPAETGTWYIVSLAMAQAIARVQPSRTDFIFPYDLVRDESGRITGARCFGAVSSDETAEYCSEVGHGIGGLL